MITVGSEIAQYRADGPDTVLAVHHQEDGQVIALGYNPDSRGYTVWDVTGSGNTAEKCVSYGVFTYDEEQAMFRYAERVAERLFTSRNAKAPGLTWGIVNCGGKVEQG